MNNSEDFVTGSLELGNATVQHMSDTIHSGGSDDSIIKIEELDLDDYQDGSALETPLTDMHIAVPTPTSIIQAAETDDDFEKKVVYRENSDPEFRSFVMVEEASEHVRTSGLQGEELVNQSIKEQTAYHCHEHVTNSLEDTDKPGKYHDQTCLDSTENGADYKDEAEVVTVHCLSDDEGENVTVPLNLGTRLKTDADLSDSSSVSTADEMVKSAKTQSTDLDSEAGVEEQLESDKPYLQPTDSQSGIDDSEPTCVEQGDVNETGHISIESEENVDQTQLVNSETIEETDNHEVIAFLKQNDMDKCIDLEADIKDTEVGTVDPKPELVATDIASINSETELESSSMIEHDLDAARNYEIPTNLNSEAMADIEFEDDLLSPIVKPVPSQPTIKDPSTIVNEPEYLHPCAANEMDSRSDQASATDVIIRERRSSTEDMYTEHIPYSSHEAATPLAVYNGAFVTKGSDIETVTENYHTTDKPENKTAELSDFSLNGYEIKVEKRTNKESENDEPKRVFTSREKESNRKGQFQNHKYLVLNDISEHLEEGAHSTFPESADNNFDDDYLTNMSSAMEKFVYFWRREDVFSQWHYAVFQANGHLFSNAEQYMMFMKADLFGDIDVATQILNTTDPRSINALGRKVSNFSESMWIEQCLYVVKNGNKQKFRQNDRMKKELFATHPKILVEANPHDQIWGIGLADYDPRAFKESSWNGLNLLGYILTEVRDELMCEEGLLLPDQKQVFLEDLKVAYRNTMMFNDPSDTEQYSTKVK